MIALIKIKSMKGLIFLFFPTLCFEIEKDKTIKSVLEASV